MRKFALLAAAAVAGLASASVSRADFVYQTTVSPEPATVTSQGTPGVANPFFGDDIVLLQMKYVSGTVQSNYALSWSISESSSASSPQFFIRTWDAALGTWDQGDNVTPGTDADLANQGSADTLGDGAVNPRGSYIRIGGITGFNVVPAGSSDQSGTFTDLQSLPGFTMTEFSSSQPAGHDGTLVSTSFTTIGEAIVPHGQEVTFSGNVISDLPTDLNGVAFSVSANAVPEPASFALIGIGAAGLLARRRRA